MGQECVDRHGSFPAEVRSGSLTYGPCVMNQLVVKPYLGHLRAVFVYGLPPPGKVLPSPVGLNTKLRSVSASAGCSFTE